MSPQDRSEREEQRGKLLWLMFFRVVVVTFLLGGTALIQLREQATFLSPSLMSLYLLIGFTYFLTFVYAILINQLKSLDGLAYLQVMGDVFFVTILIYATGGFDSLFTSAYLWGIVAASILLYGRGALIVAGASGLAYAILLVSLYFGWIHPLGDGTSPYRQYGMGELSFRLLVNTGAFFLVAALSSYLSEQERRTRRLLREKEIDYDELDALNKSVFHSLSSGLMTTDEMGLITNLNKSGADLIERRLKDIYRLHIFDIFPGMDNFCRKEDGSLRFLRRSFSLRLEPGEGRFLYLSFLISPLTNVMGARIGWILNFEDVTKLRELEKELEERLKIERELQAQGQEEWTGELDLGGIIGKSERMKVVYQLISKAAPTNANILICGESGTGKELVARVIHRNSPRKDLPFVGVNLGAVPETLMESELFGHKKGSFTGAISDRPGLFEVARGGTIFLDEVGELSPATQVKLLRVIQEKTFRPVGGTKDLEVDVRIIAATNKDLWKEVEKGRFREDLYYRLNVIQIELPPLRERREDIPELARAFLKKYSRAMNKPVERISETAMKLLMEYSYPGNVRELENIIERGVALESSDVLLPESLPPTLLSGRARPEGRLEVELPEEGIDLDKVMGDLEKGLLLKALERSQGVKRRAAEILNISFRSFRYRLAKYGLGDEGGDIED